MSAPTPDQVQAAIAKRARKPAEERWADMVERGVIDSQGRVLLRMPQPPHDTSKEQQMYESLEPELLTLLHALRDNDAVFARLADRAKWLDIERDRVIDALDAEERAARENRRRIAQVLMDAGITEAQVQWGEKRYTLKSGYLAEQAPAPRVLTIGAAPVPGTVPTPERPLSPWVPQEGPCQAGDGKTDVETPERAPATP